MEHQEGSMAEQNKASGATEYTQFCHGQCELLHLGWTSKLWERKIRESLVINSLVVKSEFVNTIKALNHYKGNIVHKKILQIFVS